jgi:hypothetical protein
MGARWAELVAAPGRQIPAGLSFDTPWWRRVAVRCLPEFALLLVLVKKCVQVSVAKRSEFPRRF